MHITGRVLLILTEVMLLVVAVPSLIIAAVVFYGEGKHILMTLSSMVEPEHLHCIISSLHHRWVSLSKQHIVLIYVMAHKVATHSSRFVMVCYRHGLSFIPKS